MLGEAIMSSAATSIAGVESVSESESIRVLISDESECPTAPRVAICMFVPFVTRPTGMGCNLLISGRLPDQSLRPNYGYIYLNLLCFPSRRG
jgi:hypothetical protein